MPFLLFERFLIPNSRYLQPKLQKCLTLDDLAREVAALSPGQEDETEIARIGAMLMQQMMHALSSGNSVNTPLGYFCPTSEGVLSENELVSATLRSHLHLGVDYAMSTAMRRALAETGIELEVQRSITGLQIHGVVNEQDVRQSETVPCDESTPIQPGQTCIIGGRSIKVGGTGDTIGVTITHMDGSIPTTYFFPPDQLSPNTPTQVGFVMPATAPGGSVWSLELCTQFNSDGTTLIKTPQTATMADYFVAGEIPSDQTENKGEEDASPTLVLQF